MHRELIEFAAGVPGPASAWIWRPAALRERAAALRRVLPSWTILYAQKANKALSDAAVDVVDGIECASREEVVRALAVGARRVAVAGPVKSPGFLRWLQGLDHPGIRLHAEGWEELRALADTGWTGPLALRVNAGEALSATATHHMQGAVPFGFSLEEAGRALRWALGNGLEVDGFAHHAMSNCLDAAEYAEHVDRALRVSADLAGDVVDLGYVNVGGGLGADPRGETIDLERLGALLPAPPAGVELACEPGRFLAAPAGYYLTEVVDLKRNGGVDFAVVRGGTHHFRLPAAWGYGHPFTVVPVERWDRPWARREVSGTVRVCGELCTPRDVLHPGRAVESLRVGDRLLMGDAGAYGLDISHTGFLSNRPPETYTVSW
ncbi:type III PLP-dependent enzyme domain-containing protein [Salininema proteolyticum]|uniref:Type III PLP-dependent enzyme n=1 Tax=Salininema proteolyticum TaxID=1607685 RepID=A0ABV8TUL5_9ACTN